MNQQNKKMLDSRLHYLLPALVGIALFAYLQIAGRYLFYYLEQQQMFLFNWHFVGETLFQVGGFGKLLAYSLAQFFVFPFAGAFVVTVLLLAVAHSLGKVLSSLANPHSVWLFAWVPSLALTFMQFQTDFFFQGTVSYTIVMLSLWAYTNFHADSWRFWAGCFGTLLLFFLTGSMALMFAISAFLWELMRHSRLRLRSFLYIIVALLAGFFAVRLSWVGDFNLAYTARSFYDAVSDMPSEFDALLVSVPVLVVVSGLLGRWKKLSGMTVMTLVWTLQLAFLVVMGSLLEKKYVERDILPTMELNYHVYHRDWPAVEKFCKQHPGNYIYLNCYNMALAEQGRLGEDLFEVQQFGPYSLSIGENTTELVSGLLSAVDYSMCNVAGSQKMAFTSCIASKSSINPHCLQRMVLTHLVQGEYLVARKYLVLLSQTLFYSNWALTMNRFLDNPAALDADPEISALRRCMNGPNHLAVSEVTLGEDLQSAALSDSTNRKVMQYLGSYYLLSKDLKGFQAFVERYLQSAGLPTLPRSFQEGVCAAQPSDPNYWRFHGVSDEVAKHFVAFSRFMKENEGDPLLAQKAQAQFGNTFWYYALFVKPQ
jgi:hypothetical protein